MFLMEVQKHKYIKRLEKELSDNPMNLDISKTLDDIQAEPDFFPYA